MYYLPLRINFIWAGLIFFSLPACFRKQVKKDFYFRDYSFVKEKGIGNIPSDSIEGLEKRKAVYVKIAYKLDKIDTIFLMNFFGTKNKTTTIKRYSNGPVSVYHFSLPSDLYGTVNQYISYSPSHIVDYFFLSPIVHPDGSVECQITDTKFNESKIMNVIIKQKDTIDLVSSLLARKTVQAILINQSVEQNQWQARPLTLLELYTKK